MMKVTNKKTGKSVLIKKKTNPRKSRGTGYA